MHAPAHFEVEVIGAIRRAVVRRLISDFRSLPVRRWPTKPFVPRPHHLRALTQWQMECTSPSPNASLRRSSPATGGSFSPVALMHRSSLSPDRHGVAVGHRVTPHGVRDIGSVFDSRVSGPDQ